MSTTPTRQMTPPAGQSPTMLHLRDGSTLTPDARGKWNAPTKFVGDLINAGWRTV